MGVTSLTSLIDKNPHLLEDIKLRDTRVIIDGCNIVYRLYLLDKLDCRYGGEYLAFAESVRSFFKLFRNCNVEPIVVMDGYFDESGAKQETWVSLYYTFVSKKVMNWFECL